MRAFHWLRADMTANSGAEPAWTVGETRTCTGRIALCERGYHSSPSLWRCLAFAPGPVACLVEVSEPIDCDDTKQVSRTRRLLAARNVERELRLFAADCAERALARERQEGREPDVRSWAVLRVVRRYADGQATDEELSAAWLATMSAVESAAESAARLATWSAARLAAWSAAKSAAWSAAESAAWSAAMSAAESAAWSATMSAAKSAAESAARLATLSAAELAAWSAAKSAEMAWQQKHLVEMILPLLQVVGSVELPARG